MKKVSNLLFIMSMFFCGTFQMLAQAEKKPSKSDIYGYWINDTKTVIVKMYDNPKGLTGGKVVWLSDSIDALGNERRDVRNSNIDLRSRKIIGMDILYDYKYDDKDHEWEGGTIYNFDNGTEYHGKMWIDKEDKLYIKGYWWWFWFLSKTKKWERTHFPPPALNTVKE